MKIHYKKKKKNTCLSAAMRLTMHCFPLLLWLIRLKPWNAPFTSMPDTRS